MLYLYLDESGDLGFDFVNGLQAADMFSWGVFRKYERKDTEWLRFFNDRIHYDGQYP